MRGGRAALFLSEFASEFASAHQMKPALACLKWATSVEKQHEAPISGLLRPWRTDETPVCIDAE